MNATIKGLLMEKEIKNTNDGDLVYCFHLFQKGNRNLITVKDVPFELFNSTKEGNYVTLDCKLTPWVQGNKNGVSVKYIGVDLVEGTTTK